MLRTKKWWQNLVSAIEVALGDLGDWLPFYYNWFVYMVRDLQGGESIREIN